VRFAICNETFQDWPLERAFGLASECGYGGVEIAPFTLAEDVRKIPAGKRREIRDRAAAADLEVVGLHWLLAKTKERYHLTTPEVEVRARTAEYLAELARLCAELGGRVLVLGSPQQRNLLPGVTPEEAGRCLADVLGRLLPVLEETGVVVGLEPLGPEWTDFMCTAAEAVAVAAMVDSPHVRLHLDCKSMASESVPIPELIGRHHRLLAHFHANDPNGQGPGFGDLDFKPVLGALLGVGYEGWVSVEVFDYGPGIERLVRRSIDYLRACLAEVTRSG